MQSPATAVLTDASAASNRSVRAPVWSRSGCVSSDSGSGRSAEVVPSGSRRAGDSAACEHGPVDLHRAAGVLPGPELPLYPPPPGRPVKDAPVQVIPPGVAQPLPIIK